MKAFSEVAGLGAGFRPDPAAVEAAAGHLASGGLLVHPTSTVYGLGGAARRDVDAEINRLKGRPAESPLLRLVPDADSVRTLFPEVLWPGEAEVMARAFWPGPLTMILDDGGEGVAVRVEPHPLVSAVLGRLGSALSSTSLNRSGCAPAADEEDAREVIRSLPETRMSVMFANGGRLTGPPPSTLVSLVGGRLRVVREGAVARSELERALGVVMPT